MKIKMHIFRNNFQVETEKPEEPEVRSQGGAGLAFLGLGVAQGGAPKALERAGRVGLSYDQTVTVFFSFNSKILTILFAIQLQTYCSLPKFCKIGNHMID